MAYQSFASKNKRFRIDIVGYAEPNNGRGLNAVAIFHDGKAITSRVLPETWPYTNGHTDRWVLEDASGEFIYVPAESRAKLINAKSLQVFTLPYRGLSAATFVGNSFAFGSLVEVYSDCAVVTRLETMISAEFPQPEHTYIESAELQSENSLHITTSQWHKGKRINRSTSTISLS